MYLVNSYIKIFILNLFAFGITFTIPVLSHANIDPNLCSFFLTSNQPSEAELRNSYLTPYFRRTDFIRLKTQEIKAELVELEKAIAASPDDVNLLNVYWYTSGLIDSRNRNLQLRTRRLEIALRLRTLVSSKESVLFKIYLAYFDLKDYEKAFTFIFMLNTDYPDNLTYAIERIRTNIKLREYSRAISLSELKLSENPDNTSLLKLGAEAHVKMASSINTNMGGSRSYKLNLFAKAETYLRKLMFEHGQVGYRNQIYYVRSLLGQKSIEKYQEALNYLTYVDIKSDKNLIQYYTVLAYMGLKQLDEAEDVLKELLDSNPSNRFYRLLEKWLKNLSNKMNGVSVAETSSFDEVYSGDSYGLNQYEDDY